MPNPFPEYLAFDDVLMKPGASSVLPTEVSTKTKLTRAIELSIPIMSAAMDTVTEAPMAIAMAQAGGLGVIHKNLDPATQAEHVARVKRYESGMVVNPITISPDATLGELMAVKQARKISGIPCHRHERPGGGPDDAKARHCEGRSRSRRSPAPTA
jgi:IMP dehydrogenase